MDNLTRQVKELARETGADLVGVATRERLLDSPPSGDPAFLLPSARSVISFAVALDREAVRSFLSKTDWVSHCEDRKNAVKKLYTIGDRLAELLKDRGFDAVSVDINNTYLPEEGAADLTEMTEFLPDFSHRYGAVAAGLGRLGWSGNLMTTSLGSLVELGSVLTSAELAEDPLLEENPCDNCRNCAFACPVGMMSLREPVEVEVAGIIERIALKRPNTCCWIGCTGYEGLHGNGSWSNWSPYRLGRPLPVEKGALDALCTKLQKADPMMTIRGNFFDDYRAAAFDPEWFYYTVCGLCRSVCFPQREERLENRQALHASGVAVLGADGLHVAAADDAVEVRTPFGVRVLMSMKDLARLEKTDAATARSAGKWPLDREVLAWVAKSVGKGRS